MDPARITINLVLILGLAGIGSLARVCSSAGRAGRAVAPASRAVRQLPRAGRAVKSPVRAIVAPAVLADDGVRAGAGSARLNRSGAAVSKPKAGRLADPALEGGEAAASALTEDD